MNYKEFFGRGARTVAKDLLGRSLTLSPGTRKYGQIAEVGAYEDGNGTDSRKGMLYAPGTLFLMPFRGFELFNVATGARNQASCVELRKIITPAGIVSGPGAITNYFGVRGSDGERFMDLFELIGEQVGDSRVEKRDGSAENCLGIYSIKRE